MRITKPSTLKRIHAALVANPDLGQLTQSLHIGPDDALPFQGWPMLFEYTDPHVEDCILLRLQTTLPESLLPRWAKPGSAFDIEREDSSSCQDFAVDFAIQEAFEELDVNPRRRGWSHQQGSDRRIGIRAWASRLWQAQAALDLYLAEMRRMEDASGCAVPQQSAAVSKNCRQGICGHYPALKLQERKRQKRLKMPAQSSKAGVQYKCLSLTREELWSQAAKQADHFDHLLLFLRSRPSRLDMGEHEWLQLKEELGGPHWPFLEGERGLEEAKEDLRIWSDKEDRQEHDSTGAAFEPEIDKAEDLLKVSREVIGLTHRFANLSLTGFLYHALDAVTPAHPLRQLSIGPIASWWDDVFEAYLCSSSVLDSASTGDAFESTCNSSDDTPDSALSRLVALRLCGWLSDADATKIATHMPRLQKMVYEWSDRCGAVR